MSIFYSAAKIIKISALFAFSVVLYSCQTSDPRITSFSVGSDRSISELMPAIAKLSARCWTSRGKSLSGFRTSSELNSLSGQPRVLIVPKRKVQGLPSLVVMGTQTGSGTNLSVFGPLLSSSTFSRRITTDIKEWAKGGKDC